ncbi:SDR family NAD(P)-dependent oxidoreductase [Pantoea cypripedii]|uniref:Short-chain dehydrogenase n=2 Tax=Pantoea cypripedii TaxID=55209 RepID=A0A1X1EKS0_PANCY|nr:SDR family NAD(P)-dependent oxidoreductase [Pantoea cypripedii]ORM89433.1 hypothetical protein HA50_22620 [Pantoea cypripedii]
MTKRIWLMTGLSSGFSKEIAQHLLTNGDAVIGTVIDYLCVTDLASKYPLDFHPQIFSEYYEQELSSAIKRIEVSGKHLDALVITDTTVTLGASEFMAPEAVKEQVSVNFTQTILLVNAAIKHFRKQGKGSIIMIGAPEMVKSMPGAGLYFSI